MGGRREPHRITPSSLDFQLNYLSIRPRETLKNRLSELRTEHGWTQSILASRLGVSRQTVISIEKGKYDPSLPLAFRIAALFGLPIEDVFAPEAAEGSEDDIPYAPI